MFTGWWNFCNTKGFPHLNVISRMVVDSRSCKLFFIYVCNHLRQRSGKCDACKHLREFLRNVPFALTSITPYLCNRQFKHVKIQVQQGLCRICSVEILFYARSRSEFTDKIYPKKITWPLVLQSRRRGLNSGANAHKSHSITLESLATSKWQHK